MGNNKGKTKLGNCLTCDKEFKYRIQNHTGKYCSNVCQQEYQFKMITLPRFYEGKIDNTVTIRKAIIYIHKNKCNECHLVDWNNKPIILEVDHINGDASNNMPDNLRLLCPNCHSQTETFSGRNRGNGRKLRNSLVAQG